MASLYILYSANLDKYYIGYTEQSPEQRLNKHLTDHKGFTGKAKDWQIVYTKEFPDKNPLLQQNALSSPGSRGPQLNV